MSEEEVSAEAEARLLYYATRDYVQASGGQLSACTGVQIQEWREDGPGTFRVAILCKGTVPTYAIAEEEKEDVTNG